MDRIKFDASIGVRVAEEQRRAIQALARVRQLREADILRAALRFYLKAQANDVQAALQELAERELAEVA